MPARREFPSGPIGQGMWLERPICPMSTPARSRHSTGSFVRAVLGRSRPVGKSRTMRHRRDGTRGRHWSHDRVDANMFDAPLDSGPPPPCDAELRGRVDYPRLMEKTVAEGTWLYAGSVPTVVRVVQLDYDARRSSETACSGRRGESSAVLDVAARRVSDRRVRYERLAITAEFQRPDLPPRQPVVGGQPIAHIQGGGIRFERMPRYPIRTPRASELSGSDACPG